MLWMIFELARSASMFGLVSPLGEFRTYFREILIIPYIVIFVNTREEQWRMFKVLLLVTLIMIPIGFFRGWLRTQIPFCSLRQMAVSARLARPVMGSPGCLPDAAIRVLATGQLLVCHAYRCLHGPHGNCKPQVRLAWQPWFRFLCSF